MITETELMAYLDGELPSKRRVEIERAVASDNRRRQLLEDERKVRQRVGLCYDPVLDEEVPQHLMAMFGKREQPAAATPTGSWSSLWRRRWDFPVALAASLVLGIFVGINFDNPAGSAGPGHRMDGSVALALDTQLTSTQTASDPIQIGITFRSQDGQVCRSYQISDATGVACRVDDAWQLKLYAPNEQGRSGQYGQAGSASVLVMGSVQEMVVDEPMDARQEREARDAGWKIGAD